jgi:hypothetical protein
VKDAAQARRLLAIAAVLDGSWTRKSDDNGNLCHCSVHSVRRSAASGVL